MSKDTGRSTPLADKEGGGDAAQVQPLCEEILKEVLYGLDGDLGLMKIQR